MNIKEVAKLAERVRGRDLGDLIIDQALFEEFMSLGEDVDECAELAEKTLTERLSEESIVKLVFILEKVIVARIAADGDMSIMAPALSGALKVYTHTAVLATIGFLIRDEIL